MFLFTYISAIFSVVSVISGVSLWLRFRSNRNAKNVAILFFVLSIWTFANAKADISVDPVWLIGWSDLALVSGFWLSSVTAVFAFQYNDKGEGGRLTTLIYLVFVFPSLVVSALLLFGVGGYSNPVINYSSPASVTGGTLAYVLVPYYLFCLVSAILALRRSYKESGFVQKQHISLVTLSLVVLGIGGLLFSIILPILGYVQYYAMGPVFSFFPIAFIGYAIFRYGFLDVRIIIQKGAIYTITLALVSCTYLALLAEASVLVGSQSVNTVVAVGLITTILGIFSVPKIDSYLRRKTDHFFFKDNYDISQATETLSTVINSNLEISSLTSGVESKLSNILRVNKVRFILPEQLEPDVASIFSTKIRASRRNKVMHEGFVSDSIFINSSRIFSYGKICSLFSRYRISLIVPIYAKAFFMGLLMVGHKKSGDDFMAKDYDLLHNLSLQMAVAIQKADLHQQVKDYADTLEEKVEERTSEIVRLHQEQETMVQELSHGLKTPLTIMKGELFLLRKQGLDNNKIDIIDGSINRISLFINKLLELYRIDTLPTIKFRRVNLRMLVEKVLINFSELISRENIDLRILGPSRVLVYGDTESLEEVVINLVSNAIKYSKPDESNHIYISLSKSEGIAKLKIVDGGLGIRSTNLPDLFEKFYRVRDTETRGIEGTGLGLAICKKIIDKHNGNISATSTFGKGTEFVVTLPLYTVKSRK